MATSAISGTAATQATPNGYAALSSDKFIKVLLSELTHQDPFQPQDSSKLLEQFSSLRNIESQLQLQDKLGDLVLQNQISAAGGMIGKVIVGIDDNGAKTEGLVASVRVSNNKVFLELDTGKELDMTRVTQIAQAPV